MDYPLLNQHIYHIAIAAISDLSDLEIVNYSAGELGCAIFPELEQVKFDGNFVESKWNNRAVNEYWTSRYGRGYLLFLPDRLSPELNELACKLTNGVSDELAVLMQNSVWVSEKAQIIRKDILGHLSSEIDCIIDAIMEHNEID